jgi:hypothetical protein
MLSSEVTVNALLAIFNVFIHPAETVRRVKGNKLAWFPPILLGGLITAAYNYTLPHITMQAMRNDPPVGVDAAKLDQMVGTMESLARFSTISAPMMFALMTLIGAALVFAACIISQVNVRFPDLYNVMAHVGLVNALQTLAHLVILKSKPATITMKELAPNFGLERFLADDAPRLLYGFVSFFSIFTIWHIVVLVLAVAALGNISKGKAFLVTAPSWLVGLVFGLIGSLFGPR